MPINSISENIKPARTLRSSNNTSIPASDTHRIVIGDRGLDSNTVEYRARTDSKNQDIALDNIVAYLQKQLR
jgi:threonyl-tRNA synthetase